MSAIERYLNHVFKIKDTKLLKELTAKIELFHCEINRLSAIFSDEDYFIDAVFRLLEAECPGIHIELYKCLDPDEISTTLISEEDFNHFIGSCKVCGAQVADYNCNKRLKRYRKYAERFDWWVACVNVNCAKHYGEGLFQNSIIWINYEHN